MVGRLALMAPADLGRPRSCAFEAAIAALKSTGPLSTAGGRVLASITVTLAEAAAIGSGGVDSSLGGRQGELNGSRRLGVMVTGRSGAIGLRRHGAARSRARQRCAARGHCRARRGAHRLELRHATSRGNPLQLACNALAEVLGQQDDVFRSRAQRGEGDDIEGETIEQVGAEAAIGCARGKVDVGGGDNAHVGVDRVLAAKALELAIFHDAQELFLHLHRGRCDLVEEERAAIGLLEAALPALESRR